MITQSIREIGKIDGARLAIIGPAPISVPSIRNHVRIFHEQKLGTTLEEVCLLERDAIGIQIGRAHIRRLTVPRICRPTIMEKGMHKLFGYPGGKWSIRNLIITSMPKHETYIDVFGGAASILIAKDPSSGEVFNDKSKEIVNFFRVVKHRPAELAERSRHWIHSRSMWNDVSDHREQPDEVERAFRFWVMLAD